MRRWLPKLAMFLIRGATVNVAVAVCLAVAVNPWLIRVESSEWGEGYSPPNLTWVVERRRVPGAMQIRSTWKAVDQDDYVLFQQWRSERDGRLMFPIGLRNVAPASPDRHQVFDMRGFPCLSLWKARVTQPWESIEIPLWPIWPGFAINTVFYAGILWAVFAAPLALRRRRRIKRGLCPKCAYDLRGTDSVACPECGTAVPLSFAQARERARVREPS